MKIEILFSDLCNIYGDFGNVMYLQKCLPDAEFINTSINEKPKFIDEDINLIYMSSMTEKSQEKVINKLMPYKEIIKEKIEKDVPFLFTGNSFEVLGKYIENDDGSKIEALGIIDLYAKREMFNRYNSLILAKFADIELVGFKDQFAMQYGDNTSNYFAEVIRGDGINRGSKFEGVKINNFIGTTILGPLLVLNPLFTKYFINDILKVKLEELPFEKAIMESYEKRLSEFKDMKRKL